MHSATDRATRIGCLFSSISGQKKLNLHSKSTFKLQFNECAKLVKRLGCQNRSQPTGSCATWHLTSPAIHPFGVDKVVPSRRSGRSEANNGEEINTTVKMQGSKFSAAIRPLCVDKLFIIIIISVSPLSNDLFRLMLLSGQLTPIFNLKILFQNTNTLCWY